MTMKRYITIDPTILAPQRVSSLIECDEELVGAHLVDVSDHPEFGTGAWYSVESGAFVQPPARSSAALLEELHARQTALIDRQCSTAICAGFASAALGALHTYSSDLDDQLNLTGAVLRGVDMPYACRDVNGVKAFRHHTAAQLRAVGDDFTLWKLQLLQRAYSLKQQLDQALAAGDLAAIEVVSWEADLA